MDYKFYEVMSDIFDENKAFKNVETIHNYERWISYDKFAKSSEFCQDKMVEAGLLEVERRELIADGETYYGECKVPKSWCVRSATLTLSTGEVLCDYETTPCSLSMYSNPTPAQGITAELAVIDDINNIPDGMDLRGKLILVNCSSGDAWDLALEKGAVGILHDMFPLFPGVRDSRDDMRGVHRWDCMPSFEHNLFAFSLSPDRGDMLRAMAKKEKVILHAKVDSWFSDIPLYVVSGAIKGSDETLPEFILYSHLDEPGANDNASGCGAILEFMRSLNEAIESGKLKRPRNTIRAIMGPEYWGSAGYIFFHPERERLGFISVDMIGNEKLDKGQIKVTANPLANSSYLDGAIILAKDKYNEYSGDNMSLNIRPFSAGSDNYVADPTLNTPAVGYGNCPTVSYHTSIDTMDRIESDILKRNILVAGYCAYMLACADKKICDEIAVELRRQADVRISSAVTKRQRELFEESFNRALCSFKRLVPELDAGYTQYFEEMTEYARKMGAGKVPVRIVKGPLMMEKHPRLREKYIWEYNSSTALHWTDGKRNIWDITIRTAAEKSMDDDEQIRKLLSLHLKMYEEFEEAGYCSINPL